MTEDGRRRNNLSLQQRREAIYRRRGKAPKRKKVDLLAKAKVVLRRTGKVVFEASVNAPMYSGLVMVDSRKLSPEAIIEWAETILRREQLRNNELRAQHGLEPLAHKSLEDI